MSGYPLKYLVIFKEGTCYTNLLEVNGVTQRYFSVPEGIQYELKRSGTWSKTYLWEGWSVFGEYQDCQEAFRAVEQLLSIVQVMKS